MVKVQLTVIHPMDGTEIPIEAESDATAGTVISDLVRLCCIPYGHSYSLIIEKSNGKRLTCGEAKKLEDYEISDGDILRISVNDKAGGAEPAQKSSPFISDSDDSKVKVLSYIGLNFEGLPLLDLKSLLEEVEGKDSRLFYWMVMLLNGYKEALEENKQSSILRENEHEKMCQDKTKLESQVKEYERKASEKKSAAILLAAANVVVALGTAFVTTNAIPSVAVILAGVIMIIIGLWLSFK